jgi:TetR/AcrR family transcriptional repressor of nem operon
MRYSAEHKKETRARILDAAAHLFRKQGYSGLGVDGLAKAAGVTNGAFYGHFKSKNEAFRTTVLDGLEELRLGVVELKMKEGKRWLKAFVEYYLGPKRTCDLGRSCALPSLSAEVMRADGETRRAYERELRRIVEEVAAGLPDQSNSAEEDRAIALLALLSGGVTLARAVSDPAFSERIGRAVAEAAEAMASSKTC